MSGSEQSTMLVQERSNRDKWSNQGRVNKHEKNQWPSWANRHRSQIVTILAILVLIYLMNQLLTSAPKATVAIDKLRLRAEVSQPLFNQQEGQKKKSKKQQIDVSKINPQMKQILETGQREEYKRDEEWEKQEQPQPEEGLAFLNQQQRLKIFNSQNIQQLPQTYFLDLYLRKSTKLATLSRWLGDKVDFGKATESGDEEANFCIVYSTHNDATSSQVLNSLKSVFTQKYSYFHVVITDRGSTDATFKLVNNMLKEHPKYSQIVQIIRLETESEPQAYLRGLKQCEVGDVAVMIDPKSQLMTDYYFKIADYMMREKKNSVFYSDQYDLNVISKEVELKRNAPYDESQIFMNLYRDLPTKYGSVVAFKTQILRRLPESALKTNGKWFKSTGIYPLIIALLELSCGKISHLSQPMVLHQHGPSHQHQASYKNEVFEVRKVNKLDYC